MTVALIENIRSKNVDLRGLDAAEARRRASQVFRKICKTASNYEPPGESADEVVEAAFAKHSLSLAGLLGVFSASVEGGLSHDPAVRDRAHEHALDVFRKFKVDVTTCLKQEIIELRAERVRDAGH